MAAPSWMGGGSYEKNPGWYRSPSIGGGLQWNPQYGFQRKQDIEKGLASGKDISQWGLTAHMGQDWQKWYPGSRTDAQLKQMGLLGQNNEGWKGYQTSGGWYDYSKAPNQAGTNLYPEQAAAPAAPTTAPTATPGTPGATVAQPPNPLLLQQAAARAQMKYNMPGGGYRRFGEFI